MKYLLITNSDKLIKYVKDVYTNNIDIKQGVLFETTRGVSETEEMFTCFKNMSTEDFTIVRIASVKPEGYYRSLMDIRSTSWN